MAVEKLDPVNQSDFWAFRNQILCSKYKHLFSNLLLFLSQLGNSLEGPKTPYPGKQAPNFTGLACICMYIMYMFSNIIGKFLITQRARVFFCILAQPMIVSTALLCQLFFLQLCQELPEKRKPHPDTEMLSTQVKCQPLKAKRQLLIYGIVCSGHLNTNFKVAFTLVLVVLI